MEGSYLVELFKTLRPDERTAFEEFAVAQLSTGSKGQLKLLALFKILLEAHPDFPPGVLAKQRVYERLFPGMPPTDGKLDKLMVEANKVLRRFLLSRYYLEEVSDARRQLDWITVLKSRQLDYWGLQALSKLKKSQQQNAPRKQEDYHDRLLTELAVTAHESDHNRLKGDLNMPQALQTLDAYYHLMRLDLLNQYLLQQKVTNLDIPVSIADAMKAPPVQERYLADSPVLHIAFKINRLLVQDPPLLEDFQDLAALLRSHETQLDPAVLREFYTYLRNFCAFLINAGTDELLPLYHQLQVDNLKRGYLYYEGNKISASAYLSVATGAIRCVNFDWALAFIEDHKGRVIGDNERFDLYHLNRANYLFAIGRYAEALDLLPPAFEYLDYTLIGKRLELKILYEMESDLLPYKAGAFKIFITRASQKFMPASLRRPNGDFVNFLLQIIRSRPGDLQRGERLSRRIQSRPHTAERDWLLDKAARLR